MAADFTPATELEEIASWVEGLEDARVVRGTIVNRIRHVAASLAGDGGEDVLLVVALRTDQADLPRRLGQVLAVAQTEVQRGAPLAWAKRVADLDATDATLLAGMYGEQADALNVGVLALLAQVADGDPT